MKVLVLNCGSSSLKYQLMDMTDESVLAKGNYERIGMEGSFLTHKVGEEKYKIEKDAKVHGDAISEVLAQLTDSEHGVINSLDEITAIGHRIAHGGEKFTSSQIVTEEVIKGIEDAIQFAPLHNPAHLQGINACLEKLPGKVNTVVFDTAFHQSMPKEHYIYPIPYEYYEKYGAHGTSHKYVALRIAELLNKPVEDLKIINCHLGQGASVCAIQNGKCVDTSMGLTPVAGIPMGSRSGDLDPSVVTFIMEKEGLTPEQMNSVLNKKSGLLGMSKVSADNRDIEQEAFEKGNEQAKLALDIYAYLIAQYIGKYAVTMNGVDVITFTAGVGERGPKTREDICSYLGFMGVELDLEKNNVRAVEKEISKDDSKVKVWIVPTDEELMIARDTKVLVENM